MEKTCVMCGKTFEGNGKVVTCSEECNFKRRRQTQRNHALKTGKFTLKKKNCKVCGKEFETYKGGKVTCSKECAEINIQQYHEDYGVKNREWLNEKRRIRYRTIESVANKESKGYKYIKKSETETKSCVICGNEFKGRKTTCSDECAKEKARRYNTEYVRQKRQNQNKDKIKVKRGVKVKNLKVKSEFEITPEILDNIMSDALYGGISYWCDEYTKATEPTSKYSDEDFEEMKVDERATKILLNGGSLLMRDIEGDEVGEEDKYTLTLQKVLDGIALFVAKGTLDINHIQLCLENLDGNSADLIIQYGLFGEIVYC